MMMMMRVPPHWAAAFGGGRGLFPTVAVVASGVHGEREGGGGEGKKKRMRERDEWTTKWGKEGRKGRKKERKRREEL